MEFERQYQTQSTFIIPDVIKNFLTYFRKCIKEQNVYGIQDAYENGYVFDHQLILCLLMFGMVQLKYLLFYRHVYNIFQITIFYFM